MKHFYQLFALLFTATLFLNCNDDSNMGIGSIDEPVATKSFAEDDGSTDLSQRTNGYKVYKLLQAAGPEIGLSLTDVNITNEQYAEIKAFTDELVAGCTTYEEIHNDVHGWLVKNIRYDYGYDQDPYPVFKNRVGICQGYANLMKVMLHTQGVPCVLTNGYIPAGGHAWCNVYFNDRWYASDPTNNHYFKSSAYSSNSQYNPTSISVPLFEDEYCTYSYYEAQLNVNSIKEGAESVTIPFSAGGFIVSNLNPVKVAASVKELYVGTNIASFGEGMVGLTKYSVIENIYIDPESTHFESFSTGVYDKAGNLKFIAPYAKHLELKPIALFDKECVIKDLPNLETITFVPGTAKIDAWAVERCPKLHTVYMPQETMVNSSAFTGVSGAFRIVRGNYTNIPQIKF